MFSQIKVLVYKIFSAVKLVYNFFVDLINNLGDHPVKTLSIVAIFYFVDHFWQFKAAFFVTLFLTMFSQIKVLVYKIFSALKLVYNFFVDLINDLGDHPIKTLAIVAIFYFVDHFWQFKAAFFVTLFLICFFFRLSSKILLGFGLIFIFVSPFLLIKLKISEVDIYAAYGYYFLFIGTLLQIVYYFQDKIKFKRLKQVE